jgi:hypothetical protein
MKWWDGTRANGRGQPSFMIYREWLTQVHHCLSSDVHILDAAPPVATVADPGSS